MNSNSLLADYYQLTMMQGYFKANRTELAVFDMFYRKNPSNGGYALLCGVNEFIDFILNLKFSKSDLEFLASLELFDEDFLEYLKDFKFNGEIYAMKEGSVIFPHEPIIRVKASILEAGFIEAALLNIINSQTIVATKASRIVRSANGDDVMEFGLRRAPGKSAGIYGAKAAVVGGFKGTSNLLAAKKFNLKLLGTHSHSWIQSFDSELEAFRTYAKFYPDKTLLLVDTYDTLRSGIPNAIKVFKELRAKGFEPLGIRIDSGDLEYLSKQARKMLDSEGFNKASIVLTNDLDEYKIDQLKLLGAKGDTWGVGTKLVSSDDSPTLGGVYKLCALEIDGKLVPKIKISNDPRKINNPGYKQVFRLYDKESNKALADVIALDSEEIDKLEEIEIFHPLYTYKRKTIKNFYAKKLLKPLFIDGKFIGEKLSVADIAANAKKEQESFWDEYLRNVLPQTYKVDLSPKLWEIRDELINSYK